MARIERQLLRYFYHTARTEQCRLEKKGDWGRAKVAESQKLLALHDYISAGA